MQVEQAIEDLKQGKLIVVADDEDREGEGDIIGLASQVTPEKINFITKHARGLLCIPVTAQKGTQLGLQSMARDSHDAFGTAFMAGIDAKSTTTGVSAYDRAMTIKAVAQPDSQASDFYQPGHLFPLVAKDGGVRERNGHTEAAIDLAKLAGEDAAYICEILADDGHMARTVKLRELAVEWQLTMITIAELTTYLNQQAMTPVADVKLPNQYGDFQLTAFTDETGKNQLVLSMGDWTNPAEVPLIRIHSECMTGDVFGSHRCDCGEQLDEAMRQIAEYGVGAVIYLRQEGRGIGLVNKLKAYELQEAGMDTYEANVALGFEPDERHYYWVVKLLQTNGVRTIKLLTNNPEKIDELEDAGIAIQARLPLQTTIYQENKNYLQTKQHKFNHMLSI